jgi:hypothetical protein
MCGETQKRRLFDAPALFVAIFQPCYATAEQTIIALIRI